MALVVTLLTSMRVHLDSATVALLAPSLNGLKCMINIFEVMLKSIVKYLTLVILNYYAMNWINEWPFITIHTAMCECTGGCTTANLGGVLRYLPVL